MTNFPHVYTTQVQGTNDVTLKLSAEKLPDISITPPKEFGGPEDHWSPETLFSASISTCFVLTFKAIARGKKLEWKDIMVEVDAYLDKVENTLSFTKAELFVTLYIPASEVGKEDIYLKALQRAEETCLITNSIKASVHLQAKVELKSY